MEEEEQFHLVVLVGVRNGRKSVLRVTVQQLTLALLEQGIFIVVVDGEGSTELEYGLLVVPVQHEDHSAGVEVLGHVVLGTFNGAVDILQSFSVHAQKEVQNRAVVVHVGTLSGPQSCFDEFEYANESLSVDGLSEILLVEYDCHIEVWFWSWYGSGCFFKAFKSKLPVVLSMVEDALTDVHVVVGGGGVGTGFGGEAEVEGEGVGVVAETEVRESHGVVEQVAQKR